MTKRFFRTGDSSCCSQVWGLKGCLWLIAALGLVVSTACNSVAWGATISYISPTDAMNSNATWPAVNGTYTQNFGIAFTTGNTGTYDIDWIKLGLNTSGVTTGSASLTIALRNTTNSTPYSAVAGTTEHAKDTVSFSMPTTSATAFTLNLTSAQLPNISSFAMQSNTSYALILYAPSGNIGMMRRTGYANGTTNNFYTVTNGFTMLDTFRNNIANYTNITNSYPSLDISFGKENFSAVPEPSSMALFGLGTLGLGYYARRKAKAKAKA